MFTTLLENQAQSRNTRHAEGVGFLCSACWLQKPVRPDCGTGYGVNKDGRLVCYDCCTKQERESMRDRSGPFYAYVSSDGQHVTSWPGGKLGRVYEYAESRSGWAGSKIARFRVLDVHGQWWAGRGAGRGMCCTLRPMKTPKN